MSEAALFHRTVDANDHGFDLLVFEALVSSS
jgi:hypothetical protein